MAKGRSDVELTIKARNEASKAISSVSSALSELRSAQAGVISESQKTGSTLEQLGTAMSKLGRQVGGLSAYERITSGLQRTGQTVAQVEQAIESLAQKQAGLASEIQKSEASLESLNAAATKVEATLAKQDGVTKAAAEELKRLNQAVKEAAAAYSKAERDATKYQNQLATTERRLASTQARHRDLTQELLRVEEPSKRLVERFEKTDQALRNQTQSVARLRDSYASSRLSVSQLGSSLGNLQATQARAAQALEQASAAQAATAAKLKEANAAVKEADRGLTKLQAASDRTAAQMEKQGESLAKARAELKQMEAAATEAGVALDRVGTAIRQRLLRELADSKKNLTDYRTEWQRTTQVIREMAASGASAKDPTPEMAKAIQDARAAKQAYEQTQIAVQRMRTAIRSAGTDVGALTRAHQTFVSALAQIESRSNATTGAIQRTASAMREAAAATGQMDTNARRTSNAMDLFVGRTRSAMSITQRLRGEVLALATAYLGLFGAIQQLKGVTQTFMDIESSQVRMGVAFDGSLAVAGREMRFIREEARRLKIDFRLLAGEYSKFAVATKGSALEGEQTRRIFIQLSEAFRVSKLSADRMRLAYLAVTQMVNKGVVSMEELRRQLGEQLYGAFRLAADSMGITAAELDKMVSTGSLVTDTFLPRFADEIEKTFSPSLAQALETYTAELGDFQNAVVETQERVAESGFIEGLTDALKTLTSYMRSQEGMDFFTRLGAAAGAAVKVLASIPDYVQQITFVFSLLVGMRVAHWLTTLGDRFRRAAAAMKPLPPATKAMSTELTAMSRTVQTTVPLMTRLQTSVSGAAVKISAAARGMTVARASTLAFAGAVNVLRGALALLGGIPGLIVTGLSLALSLWIGRTREATDAISEHLRQVNAVIDAYSVAKDKASDWASAVTAVSAGEAAKAAEDLKAQLQKEIGELTIGIELDGLGRLRLARGDWGEVGVELFELFRAMERGEVSVAAARRRMDELVRSASGVAPEIRQALINQSGLLAEAERTERAFADQVTVAEQLGVRIENVPQAIRELQRSIAEMAAEAGFEEIISDKDLENTTRLNALVETLRKKIPSLADEIKLMEGLKSIDDVLETANAIEGLDKTSEAYRRLMQVAGQARHELQMAFDAKQFRDLQGLLSGASGSIETSAALLRRLEGFQPTASGGAGALRAGFGSDTITLSDGTIQKVTQGMTVGVADANRDLVRRIGEFQATIQEQIGEDRFAGFGDQQQAVLTSIAHNFGSLPETLVKAIREGGMEDIAKAIRDLGSLDGGTSRGRREQEAFLFASGADDHAQFRRTEAALKEQLELEKQKAKELERQQKRVEQFHERLDETLELRRQELSIGERRSMQEEVSLALAKAEVDARRAGTKLSAEQRRLIQENTEVEWKRANATRDQEEAEKRINTLMQTRRDILQQMDLALKRGDLSQYDALQHQLETLDGKLKPLIQEAIRLWQALGGAEQVGAAVANLQTMLATLDAVNHRVKLMASDFGRAFGDELLTGADNFLSKIRDTGDVFGSAREAFRQFASDFLLKIAQMILRQALFNALSQAFSGSAAGSIGAGIVSAFKAHTGGIAGFGLQQSRANAAVFANALRYHTGGIAGLRPNEVPAILEKGEEVLTANDPRHINNGGGIPAEPSVKIVNAIDAGSFVSAGVEDSQGQKAILNFIRANSGAVRGALGV